MRNKGAHSPPHTPQGKLEQVSSICTDRSYDRLVIGDSAGHIRVWDIGGGIDTSSPEACRASFVEVCVCAGGGCQGDVLHHYAEGCFERMLRPLGLLQLPGKTGFGR